MNNFLAALSGILLSIMITLNGFLTNQYDSYTASVIIHMVGLLSIVIMLIVTKSKIKLQKGTPIIAYSAGALGVITIIFTNLSFTQLGVSIPLALGLFGQSVSSIVIDHFGLLGMRKDKFDMKKIIGLLLIISGIIIMMVL
ncbi:MAG: hypothetical protein K0R15_475 [Clostridiales bacterium]|nr:hypothetical protein [Clostridiales bacterium]